MDQDRQYMLEVITAAERKTYELDNTGRDDISAILQKIFDETEKEAKFSGGGAHYRFAPGVYFIDAPLKIRHAGVKISGSGHSGIDIHGLNIAGGSCFRFGEHCGPDCITFSGDGVDESFPAGGRNWPMQCARVELEGLTFVGHNNTGVDTANGYSRMRGDMPNFRELKWYPAPGRYANVERDGQRAIVLKPGSKRCKPEMLRVFQCCFTDLYVGIDIEACDVTNICHSWFAQMVYGVRNHGPGQATDISGNCFADLETAMSLQYISMSTLHHNSFAYVSKCFSLGEVYHSAISGNVLNNWKASTGAAACGAFCHVAGPARNLTMTGNSLFQEHDSRAKTLTVDEEPNGRSFFQFENCTNLLVTGNVIDTAIGESVVRLVNCDRCRVTENIITHNGLGSPVDCSGDCTDITADC